MKRKDLLTKPRIRLFLKLLLIATHSVFVIILTLFLQGFNLTRLDETALFRTVSLVKHNIFKIDPKPAGDSLLFVDVSKDLQIVEDTGLNYGEVVITNRLLLAELFSTIKENPHQCKYIICNLAFDFPS